MSSGPENIDTILKVTEIASVVGGVVLFLVRSARMVTKFEMIGEQQAKEISEVKNTLAKMSEVLAGVAVVKERLDNQGARFNTLEQRVYEMSHGQGFVISREFDSQKG